MFGGEGENRTVGEGVKVMWGLRLFLEVWWHVSREVFCHFLRRLFVSYSARVFLRRLTTRESKHLYFDEDRVSS